MPESTLNALGDHGEIGATMPTDGGNSEKILGEFAKAGIKVKTLAEQLQEQGTKSFVSAWTDLLVVICSKSRELKEMA
jgi:transaldolase